MKFIIVFLLLAFKLVFAQSNHINSSGSYKFNSQMAKSMPDAVLSALVDKMTNDFNNVAKAALIVKNGSLDKNVDQAISETQKNCKAKTTKIDLNEYRMALDNTQSGRDYSKVLTPTLDEKFRECLTDAQNKLSSLNPNLIFPANNVHDFIELLKDPKVVEQIRKLDSKNTFLDLAFELQQRKILSAKVDAMKKMQDEMNLKKEQERNKILEEAKKFNNLTPDQINKLNQEQVKQMQANNTTPVENNKPTKSKKGLILVVLILFAAIYFIFIQNKK